MCGHFGLITNSMTFNKEKAFLQGMFVNQLRGKDSTGICRINDNGGLSMVKRGMPATDYLQLKPVDTLFTNLPTAKAYMGHNRAATRGSVNNINAHPFYHGDIILAHNGSLNTTFGLPDSSKFTVDSEAIAYSINKIGAEETLKLLQGSFALVWYDKKEKTLNFSRNDERDFHLIHTEDGDIFYCSEAEMADLVLTRNQIVIKDYYELATKTILTMDLTSKEFYNWTSKDVEFYKPPTYHNRYGGRSNNRGNNRTNRQPNNVSKLPSPYKRPEEILEGNKIHKGQELVFTVYDSTPYPTPTSPYNKVCGYTSGKPSLGIVLFRVKDEQYFEAATYKAKVCGARKDPDNASEFYEIILDPDSLHLIQKFDGKSGDKPKKPEGKEGKAGKVGPEAIEGEFEEVDEEFEYLGGPNGSVLTKREWEKETKHGCCNCGGNLHEDDLIVWQSNGLPMCPVCVIDYKDIMDPPFKRKLDS